MMHSQFPTFYRPSGVPLPCRLTIPIYSGSAANLRTSQFARYTFHTIVPAY
jgi:hypothetical protein